MFGSRSKKGREIESDTWQGSLPGQHARAAGPRPGQALPGQPLAGVLAEARSGCAGGLCLGWKVGRPPAVMEKLRHWSWRACCVCVLMSTIEEEFVTFCQRC